MFKKDLLLFDLEMTGLDVAKHEVIQIAAILLDKKTLKSKQTFASFVKPANWKKRDPEAMAVNNITWEQVKDAPSLKTVLTKFNRTFGNDVTPMMYGGIADINFIQLAYKTAKMKWPFMKQYTFNLWPLFYTYMAQQKKLTNPKKFVGFTLEDVGNVLGVPKLDHRHDALVDCEYEADIFRAYIKATQK